MKKIDQLVLSAKFGLGRVVGYLRPIDKWNEGMQESFKDRVLFSVDS